ncbi:uncharacterized protein A4U43_C04F34130 [Asparagus officinalis]|uniref:K-box domain-containing protein n=1 Tax=Asparagus officinalis TaxID=4686 RepID=A0A5P1F8F3_ASPOF|nr:uncharacterized protein A4U43_C04F34130 [Asparagus officinalis]
MAVRAAGFRRGTAPDAVWPPAVRHGEGRQGGRSVVGSPAFDGAGTEPPGGKRVERLRRGSTAACLRLCGGGCDAVAAVVGLGSSERMQSTLRSLKESNHNLRKEIRQRMGEDLDELGVEELRGLEQSLDETLVHVRQRKYHVITTQTDTYKKKLKNTHETHQSLLHQLEMKDQHQGYRFVAERALSTANDATQMFAYQVHSSQQNLLELGYGSRDLSIA